MSVDLCKCISTHFIIYACIVAYVRVADYFDTGFLFLQHRIDFGIIQALKPTLDMNKINVQVRRFPHPPHKHEFASRSTRAQNFVQIMIITFVLHISSIAKDVAKDKQNTMKVWLDLFTSYFYPSP